MGSFFCAFAHLFVSATSLLMTECNRTVGEERSNLDQQVSPSTQTWLN